MLKTIRDWFAGKPAESKGPETDPLNVMAMLSEAAGLLQAQEWALNLAYRENERQRQNSARDIASLLMACGGQIRVPKEVAETIGSFNGELKVHAETDEDGDLVVTLEMRDSACEPDCCDCEE